MSRRDEMVFVALLAGYLPARRATRIQALIVLPHDESFALAVLLHALGLSWRYACQCDTS